MLTLFRQEDFTHPLDPAFWAIQDVQTAAQWPPAANMPDQGWCVPKAANVQYVNGALRLVTKKEQVDSVPYTFAFIESVFTLLAPFRVEARVQMPLGTDVWTNPVWTYRSHLEIDPLEILTRPDGGSVNYTVHGRNANLTTLWQVQSHVWHGASWFATPHDIAFQVDTDAVTMWTDGVQVYRLTKAQALATPGRAWEYDTIQHRIIVRGVKAGGWNHTAVPVTPSPSITDILSLKIYTESGGTPPPPPPPPSDPRVTARVKLKTVVGLTDAECDVVVNS